MNTRLIADAVRNSRTQDDRRPFGTVFSHSGSGAWSTPRSGKIPKPTSPHCNCRSDRPSSPSPPAAATRCPTSPRSRRRSIAVDLNEAHLSLLKLKLAGIRVFSKYSDFWQFFGEACLARQLALYRDRLWRWWTSMRAPTGTSATASAPPDAYFTDGFYRHGMLGRFIGLAHLCAKLAGSTSSALLNGEADAPARDRGAGTTASAVSFPTRAADHANPGLLFSLGIPPQQRDLLGAAHRSTRCCMNGCSA